MQICYNLNCNFTPNTSTSYVRLLCTRALLLLLLFSELHLNCSLLSQNAAKNGREKTIAKTKEMKSATEAVLWAPGGAAL